jgi:hypothetical protein
MYQNLTGGMNAAQQGSARSAAPFRQDWSGEVKAPENKNAEVPYRADEVLDQKNRMMTQKQPVVQTMAPMPSMTQPSTSLTPPASPTGQLQMSSNLSQQAIEAPVNREEVFQGSLKGLLTQNLGHYVVLTYLIGTQNPVSWEGILHSVGNDYLVIFQPDQQRYISGDFYSLKFVEFLDSSNGVPVDTGYRPRDGHSMW